MAEPGQGFPPIDSPDDPLVGTGDVLEGPAAPYVQAILHAMTDGVVVCDREGRVLTMNPAALALHGFADLAEARRTLAAFEEWFELHDLDGRFLPASEWPLVRALRGERLHDVRLRVLRKDTGRESVWSYGATSVRDGTGEPAVAFVTIQDVTERARSRRGLADRARDLEVRVEERTRELSTALDLLHGIIADSGDAIAAVDPDLRLTLMNRTAADGIRALFGVELGPGDDLREGLAHFPQERETLIDLWRRALAGEAFLEEREIRTANGRPRSLSFTGHPILDHDGNVAGAAAIIRDVTAKLRAETDLRERADRLEETVAARTRDLREREAHYRAVGEVIPYGIWAADADGRCTYASRSFLDLTGKSEQEIREFGWLDLIPPEDVAETERDWLRCVETGEPWEKEHRIRARDGTWKTVLARGRPVRNETGEITGWAGINLDITERKEWEQRLEESARQKDRFIALLGHELRNPLNALSNAAALQEQFENDLPRPIRMTAGVVARQVRQMARMVDDLLDLSRVDRGKLLLDRKVVDLATLVRTATEDHLPRARDRGIEIEVDVPTEPVFVDADEARLSQVAVNLLDNALKFTEPGGRVRIAVFREPDRPMVGFAVEDTGIGLAPEVRERIFHPFDQAHGAPGRSRGGLGLGLPLVHALVRLHGGDVAAESPGLGLGSTFVVHLPLAERAPATPEHFERSAPATRRVLVVEDQEDTVTLLVALLEREGHEVEVARDAKQGLDELERTRPDVVLCDIGLPGDLDGYDFARRVRKDHPERPIRLVAVTGFGQSKDRQAAYDAGFDLHLTKPVNLVTLRRALA